MRPTRRVPFTFRRHPDPPDGGDGGAGGDGDGDGGGSGNEPAGEPADQFKPITSQADLDRMVQDRIARERAKFADYDDLKAKAGKLDELEQQQLSELDRERAAREAAEQTAATATQTANDRLIQADVVSAAATAKALNPADVALLVRSLPADQQPTIGDDGNVIGAQAAVEAVLKDRQHMVAQSEQQQRLPGQGGASGGGAAGGDAIDPMNREQVAAAAKKLGVRLR